MAIYYAEVHAKILNERHIGHPSATEMVVQYLLYSSSIETASERVGEHAMKSYLSEGEIVEIYEVDTIHAAEHPITMEKKLDLNSKDLFEIVVLGSVVPKR